MSKKTAETQEAAQVIKETLSDLTGFTYALECIVFSMETRGKSSNGYDSLAALTICDAMKRRIGFISLSAEHIERLANE